MSESVSQSAAPQGPRFDVVTLFPDAFAVATAHGVTGRAHTRGLWRLQAWNPRDATTDVHRTVDDRPYGGGPGMVMLAPPLQATVAAAQADREASGWAPAPVVLLAPGGRRFDQSLARELSQGPGVVLVCGRYEGVDQRFIDACVTDQWSLGDFVLSGGELAALPMIDAVVRLLPGVLNHAGSALEDSFDPGLSGLLDCPHYTRPEVLGEVAVPDVLLSGHHARIQVWRREQSLRHTAQWRPDLITAARARGELTKADERFLQSLPPA